MSRKQKRILIRIIISAVLLTAFSLIPFVKNADRLVRFALFMIPYVVIGYDILKKAFKGIINRQLFDENFLMSIATLGALAVAFRDNGSYSEAVAVMLFYQLGELFQSYAVGKSRRNIAELMDIRPDSANLEIDGEIKTVPPEEVEPDSIIIVRAGEKVPLDGVVCEGSTTLNTVALTGESVPRTVREGDEIISGCVNISGVIKVKTTKRFGDSTVSKILELVENSALKKAKSEKFISKFAKIYTPAVCAGALLLATVPPLISPLFGAQAHWSEWIYRALTFLVISCPCALVISIPLTFFAGIGGASKQGILVKGASYLETLSKTKYVLFDKTGTVTEGVFELTKLMPENGVDEAELLKSAAYAEVFSSHPIAQSILKAYTGEIDKSEISGEEEISGKGIKVRVGEDEICVGNAALMRLNSVQYKECNETGTVIYVAKNAVFLGSLLISDKIKPTAAEAVKALKAAGVKKAVMLTGDNAAAANKVADYLELDGVYSSLLPEGKVKKVEQMLAQKDAKETLAFVGDGINDAPVLSRADIGIAMGALGSDAAIEAADVVLMDDDPLKISKAIGISKKCLRIVYENIYFAIGVKMVCLLLGALGIANMWLAIFADVGVMILAIINAVRALRNK